jgi:hypothetical protein
VIVKNIKSKLEHLFYQHTKLSNSNFLQKYSNIRKNINLKEHTKLIKSFALDLLLYTKQYETLLAIVEDFTNHKLNIGELYKYRETFDYPKLWFACVENTKICNPTTLEYSYNPLTKLLEKDNIPDFIYTYILDIVKDPNNYTLQQHHINAIIIVIKQNHDSDRIDTVALEKLLDFLYKEEYEFILTNYVEVVDTIQNIILINKQSEEYNNLFKRFVDRIVEIKKPLTSYNHRLLRYTLKQDNEELFSYLISNLKIDKKLLESIVYSKKDDVDINKYIKLLYQYTKSNSKLEFDFIQNYKLLSDRHKESLLIKNSEKSHEI